MTNRSPRPAITHLEAALGIAVEPGLMQMALTHRSYAYENGGLPTNERLEFLGDSVLGIVVTNALFHAHPDLPEGKLAKLRASVVNSRALADAPICCWAGARRRPAGATRRASSPTPSKRCWARSTWSTGWASPNGSCTTCSIR
jgi:ribonuclease-3